MNGENTIKKDIEGAAGAAEQASNSRAFVAVARAGFAVSGVLHVLIGIISIQLAFGDSGDADQGGAIAQLAAQPAGYALIWIGAVACLALGLWEASSVVFGYRQATARKRLGKKLAAGGRGIVFLALAAGFASFALGNRKDSGDSTSDASARLMQMPGGSLLLLAVGAGIAVTGIVFAVRGVLRSFAKRLVLPASRPLRTATVVLGVFGHVAKGIALFLLGLLFIVATLQSDPEESTGLDGALKSVLAQPFGIYALVFIGVGLGCYGIYLVFKSRLAKMD
ncbi:DUF1206 domain-containing protein [Paeniglutamicibacter sp. MACA_103]|uniref:DUF1206 domain-containing protein n=1 Tax=Paeniglutamicibacter sp. MACA_103 TaxID=3377337 RepID=UPI0038948EA4